MINENDTSHTQCPAPPNWCQSMQWLWCQRQSKQDVLGSCGCTRSLMVSIKMPELPDTAQFPLYWVACISVGVKSLRPSVPAALKVSSGSSATQWSGKCPNDLWEYLALKEHKVLQLMRLFLCIADSHCWKIQKIQIMSSVNVLKLAALASDIYVSVICQFMNIHHNMRFIISDGSGGHSAESDMVYE